MPHLSPKTDSAIPGSSTIPSNRAVVLTKSFRRDIDPWIPGLGPVSSLGLGDISLRSACSKTVGGERNLHESLVYTQNAPVGASGQFLCPCPPVGTSKCPHQPGCRAGGHRVAPLVPPHHLRVEPSWIGSCVISAHVGLRNNREGTAHNSECLGGKKHL